jgi:hypothetical protein
MVNVRHKLITESHPRKQLSSDTLVTSLNPNYTESYSYMNQTKQCESATYDSSLTKSIRLYSNVSFCNTPSVPSSYFYLALCHLLYTLFLGMISLLFF